MRPTPLLWAATFLLAASAACSSESDPPVPTPPLPGAVGDPATSAIPVQRFALEQAHYADGHPDLPGLLVSYDTALLGFRLDATVGQANDALLGVDAEVVGGLPGEPGDRAGLLAIRIPSSDHETMRAAVAQLRDHAAVLTVAPDVRLGPHRVFRTAGTLPSWKWDFVPEGGNWGLEITRIPEVWNLYPAWAKDPHPAQIGVIDSGFATNHEDLVVMDDLTAGRQHWHGTFVAGIIGAGVGNGRGIDGIDPMVDLVVEGVGATVTGTTVADVMTSVGELLLTSFADFRSARPDVRVINVSLGYNWGNVPFDPSRSASAAALVATHGEMVVLAQRLWQSQIPALGLPLLVVSAGNDSNDGLGLIQAKWSSPFTYAGLELGAQNILVVESIDNAPLLPGGGARSDFSNIGGHVSAPGGEIVSLFFDAAHPADRATYARDSGTSFSAPHVTGVLSLLSALAPDLDNGALRDLLIDHAVDVSGGASGRIDAFASAMDIDRIRGDRRLLKMLLDVDDGTLDGNQRVDLATGQENTSDDADGDFGPGDGVIDMSDFRLFRDHLLQVEASASVALDGRGDHPKKDLNGDGEVRPPGEENVRPRVDFNGDGRISRDLARYVPGAVGAELTDLGMLELLFEDPEYEASALSGLLDSGDVLIDGTTCLEVEGARWLESSLARAEGAEPDETRVHEPGEEVQLYTVPVVQGAWHARIEVVDGQGQVVSTAQQTFDVAPGSDHRWAPTCEPAEREWKKRINDAPGYTKVAIQPTTGVVYAAGNNLYALTPGGQERWVFELCGSVNSSPTINPKNDRILFGLWTASRSHLYAVEPWGEQAWMFETELLAGASIHSSPAIGPPPDYDIYFTAADDFLYCIEDNGAYATRKWRIRVPQPAFLPVSSPVISADGSAIYVGGGDGNLYAIRPGVNPSYIGIFPVGGQIRSTPAIGEDGTIYVGSDDDSLYAISPQGALRWRFETGHNVVSSPALGEDGTIYVGSEDRNFYAVNPDGTERWRYAADGPIQSSPAVGADGTIYFGAADDNVYALYPDGRLRWKLDARHGWTGCDFNAPVTISNTGQVFAVDHAGFLYAIDSGVEVPGLADSPWPTFQRDNTNSGWAR